MSKYDYLHALYQALIPLKSETRRKIMRDVEDQFRDAEENNINESDITKALGSPHHYAKQFLDNLDNREDKTYHSDDILLDSLKSSEAIITKAPNLIGNLELASDPIENNEEEINVEITKEVKDTFEATHYDLPKTKIKKVYTSPQAMPKNKVANHPVKIIALTFAMLLFNSVFILGPFIAIWSIIIALVASGFAVSISGLVVLFSGVVSFPLSFISLPIVMLSHPILLFSFGFLLTGAGGLLTIAMIYVIRLFGYITLKYFSWNLSVIRGY